MKRFLLHEFTYCEILYSSQVRLNQTARVLQVRVEQGRTLRGLLFTEPLLGEYSTTKQSQVERSVTVIVHHSS